VFVTLSMCDSPCSKWKSAEDSAIKVGRYIIHCLSSVCTESEVKRSKDKVTGSSSAHYWGSNVGLHIDRTTVFVVIIL